MTSASARSRCYASWRRARATGRLLTLCTLASKRWPPMSVTFSPRLARPIARRQRRMPYATACWQSEECAFSLRQRLNNRRSTHAMTVCKGIVKNNLVLLEEGVHLPDGVEVEVRLLERPLVRHEAFARVLANRITRYVGMDAIIEEDKQERE